MDLQDRNVSKFLPFQRIYSLICKFIFPGKIPDNLDDPGSAGIPSRTLLLSLYNNKKKKYQ